MAALAGLGTLSFIVVGALVGIRLLLLWRRTRQRPELLLGVSLTSFSIFGQPMAIASEPLREQFGRDVGLACIGIALLALVISMSNLYTFTYQVFRSDSKVARAVVACATLLGVAASISIFHSLSLSEVGAGYSTATKIGLGVVVLLFDAVMLWAGVESLMYRSRLARQLSLGLADPVIVNRFALWGAGYVGAGCAGLGNIACVALDMNLSQDPVPLLLTAFSGTWIGGALYFSMLAPEWYVARTRARSAASMTESS